jgi:Protein of unknown function (DUF998)
MNTKRTIDRIIHAVAGIGPLLFLAIATIEGFLRAGYDPIAQPISALAIGPRGFIQEVNFALLAASLFSFAAVLRNALRPGPASVAAPGVFAVMTIGIVMAGIFTMDAQGAAPTLVGQLHTMGGFLFFPWMPVVLLLVARRFRRDARWRPYFTYTLVTGLACLAIITFFLIFVGPPPAPRPLSALGGLVQRLQLLPFFTWMAIIAHVAYRRATRAPVTVHAIDASRALST